MGNRFTIGRAILAVPAFGLTAIAALAGGSTGAKACDNNGPRPTAAKPWIHDAPCHNPNYNIVHNWDRLKQEGKIGGWSGTSHQRTAATTANGHSTRVARTGRPARADSSTRPRRQQTAAGSSTAERAAVEFNRVINDGCGPNIGEDFKCLTKLAGEASNRVWNAEGGAASSATAQRHDRSSSTVTSTTARQSAVATGSRPAASAGNDNYDVNCTRGLGADVRRIVTQQRDKFTSDVYSGSSSCYDTVKTNVRAYLQQIFASRHDDAKGWFKWARTAKGDADSDVAKVLRWHQHDLGQTTSARRDTRVGQPVYVKVGASAKRPAAAIRRVDRNAAAQALGR